MIHHFDPTDTSPLRAALAAARSALWLNPGRATPERATARPALDPELIVQASDRFIRFAPLLARLFPDELARSAGRIESPLAEARGMAAALSLPASQGRLLVKQDHLLPVAGSIKARGGIHEVLELAERLARQAGLLRPQSDAAELDNAAARAFFGRHSVAVGSTGNLGLSIGVMASALGFQATVHMSADAKDWKKERLRQRGVRVVEHSGDYAQAVAEGRQQAAADPLAHFVDDEQSLSLFQGYAAAAPALARQLRQQQVAVDAEHPLFVYLPCGVGGAPAGIAFGLWQVLGPHVHCFFAEPVQSPCMLVQMLDGGEGPGDRHPSVYDYGLDNRTEADGLAVPRASLLASAAMRPILSGLYTVTDAQLLRQLYQLERSTGMRVEPSAAAGFSGPRLLLDSDAGQAYLRQHGLLAQLPRANHLCWTTGGLYVPAPQYQQFWQAGRQLAGQ